MGALLMFGVLSCSSANKDNRTFGPYTLAISETTKPALATPGGGAPLVDPADPPAGIDGIYQVQTSVIVPLIDRPAIEGAAVKPYPRPIWYTSADLRLQLTYVITNLEDKPRSIELLVDGWNEFIRYTPLVTIDDEGNVNADRSMVDRRILLPAKGRVVGTVSFDDFERMALELGIIMNGAPNPFHVVEPHTEIFTDIQTKPFIPTVTAGLTGFDLNVRSLGPAKLALEATLEVDDRKSLLVAEGETSGARPPGKRYNPVVATPAP